VRSCNGTIAFPLNPTRFTRIAPAPSMDLNSSDAAIMRDHLLSLGIFTAPLPDPDVVAILQPYRDNITTFRNRKIATVTENICHTRGGGAVDSNCPGKDIRSAVGGGVCHIVAKSFLYNAPTADVAIQNAGGCRTSMFAGNFTYDNAYTILPFANTLVTLVMTGDQIKRVLEDSVQFFLVLGGGGGAYPFAAGLRWFLNYSAPFGNRFDPIFVNKRLNSTWVPLNLTATYKVRRSFFVYFVSRC
jgi:5'-nucleotidase / UDP-sugar diphosphatase